MGGVRLRLDQVGIVARFEQDLAASADPAPAPVPPVPPPTCEPHTSPRRRATGRRCPRPLRIEHGDEREVRVAAHLRHCTPVGACSCHRLLIGWRDGAGKNDRSPRGRGFNQPYAKGLARLREKFSKTDFDRDSLAVGTMQARADRRPRGCETFGAAAGGGVPGAAAHGSRRGGRQIWRARWPLTSSRAGVVLRHGDQPHRLRVSRGSEDRLRGHDDVRHSVVPAPGSLRSVRLPRPALLRAGRSTRPVDLRPVRLRVRFDSTIPAGAETCFTLWRATEEERGRWEAVTRQLDERALVRARRPKPPPQLQGSSPSGAAPAAPERAPDQRYAGAVLVGLVQHVLFFSPDVLRLGRSRLVPAPRAR